MPRLLACLAVVLLAASSLAQMPASEWVYDAGSVAFDYAQTPFPTYSGSFEAEGPALMPDGTFPPGEAEVVGGFTAHVTPDTVQTAFYAATANADGTFDLSLVALRTLDYPTPGTYSIDVTGGTALFGFIDDAASADLPDTLDQQHLMEWLTNLPATHKLVSVSGSITLAAADEDTLHGSFSGLTTEVDGSFFFVNVSNGQFNLSGGEPALDAPPAASMVRLTPAPNPFNPQTSMHFTATTDGHVRVSVYDAAGRLVRTLLDQSLTAGPHAVPWNGRNDQGRAAPAGTYLVRAVGPGWRAATAVTLVP